MSEEGFLFKLLKNCVKNLSNNATKNYCNLKFSYKNLPASNPLSLLILEY
jgi:hypothetical protein